MRKLLSIVLTGLLFCSFSIFSPNTISKSYAQRMCQQIELPL